MNPNVTAESIARRITRDICEIYANHSRSENSLIITLGKEPPYPDITVIERAAAIAGRVYFALKDEYALNDSAHQLSHVISVLAAGLVIVKNEIGQSPKSIVEDAMAAAAACHDAFCRHRKAHHEMSAAWARGNPECLDGIDYLMVADMCQSHRASCASSKAWFTGIHDQMFNAADRGWPTTARDWIIRSYNYTVSNSPTDISLEEVNDRVIAHAKEKIGTGGYAHYPERYMKVFGAEVARLREEIDRIVAGGTIDHIVYQ